MLGLKLYTDMYLKDDQISLFIVGYIKRTNIEEQKSLLTCLLNWKRNIDIDSVSHLNLLNAKVIVPVV